LNWYFFIIFFKYAWDTSDKKNGAHSTHWLMNSLNKAKLEGFYWNPVENNSTLWAFLGLLCA